MSKSFIEGKKNNGSLRKAVRQYEELSYYLQSDIQKDVSTDYFEKYAERHFNNNEFFLNYIKNITKTSNFLTFAKYYRNPNPSSYLINTRIKEPLSRVFFSEDSQFKYLINNKEVSFPKELEDDFQQRLFDAVLFRYNDIIVHDLFEKNKPYRDFISIKNVVSIEMKHGNIDKIAYTAMTEVDGEDVYGYAYIDSEKYQFYSKDLETVHKNVPHDLGFCPATFVVKKPYKDCDDEIVKESLFSYLRSELESYCYLKTLQRVVDAKGTLPIMVKTKTNEVTDDIEDFDARNGEPMSIMQLGGQVSKEARATAGSGGGDSTLDALSVIETPAVEDKDGKLTSEFNKNFIVFHYTPTEALEFLNKRIKTVEESIIISSIGNYSENGNPKGSKSDTEIKSNDIVFKQDKLRFLSNTLSVSRALSDKVMLSLAYGRENVDVTVFYGSDFFLETQETLYEMFKNSPNAIERKNILIRLSQRRNMLNKDKSNREVLLYKILPYSSDADFKLAIDNQMVSKENFELQIRFNYWIARFESFYGDILVFFNDLGDIKENEKVILITEHILQLIKTDSNFKLEQNGKEPNE